MLHKSIPTKRKRWRNNKLMEGRLRELLDDAIGYSALTEYEFDGLSAQFGFADGHAYHDLEHSQKEIVERLPSIWSSTSVRRQRDAERRFARSFYQLAHQFSVLESDDYRICTTASQSIDIACAWASRNGKRVTLIEPTFDNLALIARRWRLPLQPISENALLAGMESVDPATLDVLFLVNPNNPTGTVFDETSFARIVAWCARYNKPLIVDACFRFFNRAPFDLYRPMIDSGIDFIVIEDTGKTWATMDMKASIIAYSPSLKSEIEQIFHEIFLGVSPFCLAVLTEFISDSRSHGLERTLWHLVARNRRLFRDAIKDSCLKIDPLAVHSSLALEWVTINHPSFDDLSLTEYLKRCGIACLPGRFFHWSLRAHGGQKNVRFSLLKPGMTIDRGLPRLMHALSKL